MADQIAISVLGRGLMVRLAISLARNGHPTCCGVTTPPMSPSWNKTAATRLFCRMSFSCRSAADRRSATGGTSCPRAAAGGAEPCVRPGTGPGQTLPAPGYPYRLGLGAGLELTAAVCCKTWHARCWVTRCRWRSSPAPPCWGAGRRSADRHLGGVDPRRLRRRSLPAAALWPFVPGLYQSGLYRSATGRGCQERHRHRCRSLRRVGFWRQRQDRAHHPGLGRDAAPGRRARCRRQDLHGDGGLGDLVLTCTDNQSRNRRFGLALGGGKDVNTAMTEIGQVVEGYRNTRRCICWRPAAASRCPSASRSSRCCTKARIRKRRPSPCCRETRRTSDLPAAESQRPRQLAGPFLCCMSLRQGQQISSRSDRRAGARWHPDAVELARNFSSSCFSIPFQGVVDHGATVATAAELQDGQLVLGQLDQGDLAAVTGQHGVHPGHQHVLDTVDQRASSATLRILAFGGFQGELEPI